MSIQNFKPAVWSKNILGGTEKDLVWGGPMVVNDDYEGEISGAGDVVKITQFGDPTIGDYTQKTTINYEDLEDAGLDLVIDQAKYFAFKVDDVDKRQAAGDMQGYLEERASYRLADTADKYIAGMCTGAAVSNVLPGPDGTSSSISAGQYLTPEMYGTDHEADFYLQVILPLKVRLTQANVPMNGRWLTVPAWAEAMLESTKAFVSVTDMQGQPSEVFQEGFIGRAGGFNIMVSNNAIEYDQNNGAYYCVAGHRSAITFGEQIVETEALRLQTSFSDAVRGLHVYGGKLVRPDFLAIAGVKRPLGI